MTTVDIYISVGSVILSAIGILYVLYVVRNSGRDRPHDPEAVKRLVEHPVVAKRIREIFPDEG